MQFILIQSKFQILISGFCAGHSYIDMHTHYTSLVFPPGIELRTLYKIMSDLIPPDAQAPGGDQQKSGRSPVRAPLATPG